MEKRKHFNFSKLDSFLVINVLPYILILFLSMFIYKTLDCDSYYMITDGKAIVSSGLFYNNPYIYYDYDNIVIQQWLYSVIEYLFSLVPNGIGLFILMLVQMFILYRIIYLYAYKFLNSKIISSILSFVCCFCFNAYFCSLRPENLTLIFLFLQIMALNVYSNGGSKKLLIIPPLLTLAEANLHGSMWFFHVLVYITYLLPMPIIKEKKLAFTAPVVKINLPVIISILAVVASGFANPYGIDGALYTFRSMKIFDYVSIGEQSVYSPLSETGVLFVIILLLFVYIVAKGKFKLPQLFYLSLGFMLVSAFNHHATMFMPIPAAILLTILFSQFDIKDIAIAMKTKTRAFVCSIFAGVIVVVVLYCSIIWPKAVYEDADQLRPMADYINNNGGGAVMNYFDAGSCLLYLGVRDIFTDTRPEFMLKAINKTHDMYLDYMYLSTGLYAKKFEDRYGSIEDYLDKYNIKYLVVPESIGYMFIYIYSYIDNSPNWRFVDLGTVERDVSLEKRYYLYERVV